MNRIDLHVHSTYSDGTDTPAQIVDKALSLKMSAIALTDHDTVDGLAEAFLAAKDKPIEIIPGIELSTDYNGKDVHVLGYYINPFKEDFVAYLDDFKSSRDRRNVKMCEKMTALGMPLTLEELQERYQGAVLTRMHFAKYMSDMKYVPSTADAFKHYLSDDGPIYVPREKITPFDAVKLILKAGGVPVLAHPILYKFTDAVLENLISKLKDVGLKGIETVYSTYAPCDERQIRSYAAKYNLITTGGSDYHGIHKPDIDLGIGRGSLFVPEEYAHFLKSAYLENYNPNPDHTKLMLFDMDGSLLNDDKIISPLTKEALFGAVQRGNICTIATGRHIESIKKVLVDLQIDSIVRYIAAFNGSLIWDMQESKVISRTFLDEEIAIGSAEIMREEHVHFHSYSETDLLAERVTPELEKYSGYVKLPYRIVDDAIKEGGAPYKIVAMDLKSKANLERVRRRIEDKFGDRVQTFFSCDYIMEIMPPGAGKGTAVTKLCDILNIPAQDSYAFADEENDVSMFEQVGNAVCLSNGSASAKKVSDYITFEDNNNDGLKTFLDRL